MDFEIRDTEEDIESLEGLRERVDDQGLPNREEVTESAVVQVQVQVQLMVVDPEIRILEDDHGGLQGRLGALVCVMK